MPRKTISIVLRLTAEELADIDKVLPKGVARTWWIRGAIRQRLQNPPTPESERSPYDHLHHPA